MRYPWGLMERLDLVEGAINLPPGKYAPVASATEGRGLCSLSSRKRQSLKGN